MKKGLFFFFLLLLGASLHAKSTYFDEKSGIHLSVPSDWQALSGRDPVRVSLLHNDLVSSINVYVYTFGTPVTANALYQRVMSSVYDGWINLMQRKGSLAENQQANVDDSHVAVFSKNLLGDNLQVKKVIIGEYYYIKGNTGYVISIRTDDGHWATLKNSAKKVIDSFWVGKGAPPIAVAKKIDDATGWQMIGLNSANSYYCSLSVLQSAAQTTLNVEATSPPVTSKNSIFFANNNTLYSESLIANRRNWEFTLQGSVHRGLVFQDDILNFVQEGEPCQLFGVFAENGNVLYKVSLESASHSDLIYSNESLYIVDGSKLRSFASDTGSEQWAVDLQLDFNLYPVVSGNHVLVVSQEGSLLDCDSKSGTERWRRSFDVKPLFSPTIMGDRAIVTFKDCILSVDLNTGDNQWKFPCAVIVPPSAGDQIIALTTSGNVQILAAIRPADGAPIWETPVTGLRPARPLVTEDRVLVRGVGFSNKDGKQITSSKINKNKLLTLL